MPAPSGPTYSLAVRIDAHTALRDRIDSGSGAGFVRIRTNTDTLLAQIPLTDPCGTVNGTTGILTLTTSGRDESADATGTAAYGEICDSTGAVHLALPAIVGSTAIPGFLVLNTVTIGAGGPVELLTILIG
jgi:hypothetical protein